jgi:hypothetical protein
LVTVFLDTGFVSGMHVPPDVGRFSVELAREIWVTSTHPGKTEDLYVAFIDALERKGLIPQ